MLTPGQRRRHFTTETRRHPPSLRSYGATGGEARKREFAGFALPTVGQDESSERSFGECTGVREDRRHAPSRPPSLHMSGRRGGGVPAAIQGDLRNFPVNNGSNGIAGKPVKWRTAKQGA